MVARKKSNLASRVYKFGVVFPKGFDYKPPDYLIAELRKQNQLWNNLVAASRKSFEDYKQARRQASENFARLDDGLDSMNEAIDKAYKIELKEARKIAGTRDGSSPEEKAVSQKIAALKEQQKELMKQWKEGKKKADTQIDKTALRESYNARFKELRRTNGNHIMSITANSIARKFETARQKAFEDNARLQFHRFDGTGRFFYSLRKKEQNRDGLHFDDLFDQEKLKNKDFHLISVRRKGADGSRNQRQIIQARAKIAGARGLVADRFEEFDIILHRPFPKDALLMGAELVRKRTGNQFRWDICFTLRLPPAEPATRQVERYVGVDLNWRQIKDEAGQLVKIEVATAAFIEADQPDDEIACEKLSTQSGIKRTSYVETWLYQRQLQSGLSDSAEKLGKAILSDLKKMELEEGENHYLFWSKMKRAPAHVPMNFEQAFKLSGWCRAEPDRFPSEMAQVLKSWRQDAYRPYLEMHNLRRRLLEWRKDDYRNWAAKIVASASVVVVEDISLAELAKRNEEDNKLSNKALSNRFMVAPGELRAALKNAAEREGVPFVKVNPAYTSKTCSVCNTVYKELGGMHKWHCPSCHTEHDRDENAAINIAKKGMDKINTKKSEK